MAVQTNTKRLNNITVVYASANGSASEIWIDYLRQLPDFTVFCWSGESKDLLTQCQRLAPCVLIIEDVCFRWLDRAELQNSTGSSIQIMILAADVESTSCENYLSNGCSGILERDCSGATFSRAIRAVVAGEYWIPRRILSDAYRQLLSVDRTKKLTRRESDIFALMARGKNNREIADTLFITRETVRWHVRGIYSKIGIRNRRDVASIDPDQPKTSAAEAC